MAEEAGAEGGDVVVKGHEAVAVFTDEGDVGEVDEECILQGVVGTEDVVDFFGFDGDGDGDEFFVVCVHCVYFLALIKKGLVGVAKVQKLTTRALLLTHSPSRGLDFSICVGIKKADRAASGFDAASDF